MRELTLIPDESNQGSLVFRTVDAPEEQFFLAVDETLRHVLLHGEPPASQNAEGSDNAADDDTVVSLHKDAPAGEQATGTQAADDSATSLTTQAEHSHEPESAPASASNGTEAADAEHSTPERPQDQDASEKKAREASSREIDPRLSSPLLMRPREIQDRIRGGASVAELAEENGVTESRIEPYAHPVLQERARLAEMAKRARPVREDGPAPLTLWEVLATAFAARGIDLTTTTWDAYRDPSNQWVVRVSWRVGLSENTAEWSYHRSGMNEATAVARNGIAADLIDPDFAQPVRRLPMHPLLDDDVQDDISPMERTRDDLVVIAEQDSAPTLPFEQKEDEASEQSTEVAGEDFFVQEEAEQKPASKRRRRAVTPHWEDVLLGVRANTKRPKN